MPCFQFLIVFNQFFPFFHGGKIGKSHLCFCMYFNDFYVMVTSYVCLLLKKVGKKTLLISFKSCKNEQQKRKYMNCILNLDLFLTTLSTPSISTS